MRWLSLLVVPGVIAWLVGVEAAFTRLARGLEHRFDPPEKAP